MADRPALGEARAALEGGRPEETLRLLGPLLAQSPASLDLLALAQDARLAQAGTDDPRAAERALLAADGALAPANRVWLLARVSESTEEARALLEEGLASAPDHADLLTARAALALEGGAPGRWAAARGWLLEALAADPGHLGARRLQAWMWAQEGSPVAGDALRRWLAATASDPRVSHASRVEAALDLATVRVREGRSTEALAQLEALRGEAHDRSRRLAIEAVVRADLGELGEAEALAWASASAAPGDSLPWVQLALLGEARGGTGAEEWARVAQVAGSGTDLAAVVQALRARVAAARRAREERTP
ncbi:MAG: hypothetical protein ISQ08_06035 [Planctomycetes bacterium]|nr:hypothetical protein [Planctomycetota bacterium]